jgi:hypothetical protein
MIVGSLARRPLILVGEGWKRMWTEFYAQLSDYSPPSQRELLAFAGTARAAADMLGPNPA